MDLGLTGKRAIVTGASKGLGYATAATLLDEGARVVINSRSEARLQTAQENLIKLNGSHENIGYVAGDVSSSSECEKIIAASVQYLGGIDILITNSGGPPAGSFDQFSEQDWEEAVDLAFMSHLNLIKSSLQHLKNSDFPSVLAITSLTVKYPLDNLILSNTVRAATAALIKSLSIELGQAGIRFNSIMPGWTMTDRVIQLLENRAKLNNSSVDQEKRSISSTIPLKRMGQPEEFARAAAFLVSPAASYVTGVMLSVDGGITRGLF